MAVGEFDSLQALNSFKIKELKGKNEADLAKEIDKEYADAADEYPKVIRAVLRSVPKRRLDLG